MIPLTVAEPFKSASFESGQHYQAMSGIPVDFALEQAIALLDAVDCSLGDGISSPVLVRLAVRAAMASVESVLMALPGPDKGDAS